MIIIAKTLKQKVKAAEKQINKEAVMLIDKHVDKVIDELIKKQTCKRITEKSLLIQEKQMRDLPPDSHAQCAYIAQGDKYCKCKIHKGKLVDGWSHLQCLKCKLPILGIDIRIGTEVRD